MTTAVEQRSSGYLDRPRSSSLADVVELILDKGLVIDVYVRVSVVGIEILTIDARIVIASVETYLKFAEATNRLDLYEHGGKDLGEMTESLAKGGASGKTSGVIDGAKEKVSELLGSKDDDDDSDEDDEEQSSNGRSRRSRSSGSGRSSHNGSGNGRPRSRARQSSSRRRSQEDDDDE
jgi:hypothetical protein